VARRDLFAARRSPSSRRGEDHDAAGTHVHRGCLDGCAEVVLRRQVRDRVVDEDDVERPAEAQRAHVALDVLALGIERPREREHLREMSVSVQ
jgi:hypothetical protein